MIGFMTPFQRDQLKKKIELNIDLKKLFNEIDKIYALSGAGVRYIDSNLNIIELRPFSNVCRLDPIYIILREPYKSMSPEEFSSYLKQNQDNPKERNLVLEASGAALSCGAAALSWLVVISSAGAIPLTAGASTPLTYLSTSAAIASTIQCVNGGLRTYNEISGNAATNDELDTNEWYVTMNKALDIISLAGAGASYAITIKAAKLAKKSSGKSFIDILKGLNRADRKRLTEEVIRMQNPNVSNSILKKYIQSGVYPKRYSNFGIKRTYVNQLKDAIGASFSFSGSAVSGVLNGMIIGVWENAHDK